MFCCMLLDDHSGVHRCRPSIKTASSAATTAFLSIHQALCLLLQCTNLWVDSICHDWPWTNVGNMNALRSCSLVSFSSQISSSVTSHWWSAHSVMHMLPSCLSQQVFWDVLNKNCSTRPAPCFGLRFCASWDFIRDFAALFVIARTWKQPRCPSADEWTRKLWYIYTMEYYSAIKSLNLSIYHKGPRLLIISCISITYESYFFFQLSLFPA